MTPSPSTYHLICGMEVHAELKTASKMFCGCKNDPFHAPGPNTYTCPVCLGMPGALPVANQKAIEWVIKFGLALNCNINLFSKFDRKHYFYPDLPKGYQISQYDLPFCYDGVIETSDGPVRIRRIHLEEDTGKLLHKTIDSQKVTLIDFNRSSVPLMEIVTEPDIHSAAQAKECSKKIRHLLRYLDLADCDMEQGGMRLEANVSLATEPDPTELPNYKVELKNINSFRFLEQAIEFEIDRQGQVLNEGTTPVQETRGWDSTKNVTFSQRIKEDAEDYRYFPDPDIPPIRFTQEHIDEWRNTLPLLPDKVVAKWSEKYGIESRYSEVLVENQSVVDLYESFFAKLQSLSVQPNTWAADAVNGKTKFLASQTDISAAAAAYVESKTVSNVEVSEIVSAIDTVATANPDAVAKFQAGKTEVVGFFMGQVIRQLGKKVDPNLVKKLIADQLTA